MKKWLSLALTMVILTGSLAACGSSSSSGSGSSSAGSSSSTGASNTGDKKLTFGFWGDTAEAEMKMQLAKDYMAANPGLDIEFEYTDGAGYLTKMQTWFSSNTVPDVFGVASDTLFQFIGSDKFEDLASYIEKDNLSDAWDKNTVESIYSSEGKVYAAPFISKVFAIAYNKDLFDAANIAYPTADWTEADMLSYAEKLTSGEGTDKTYGIRWGVRPTEFYRNLYGDPVYDVATKKMNATGNEQFKHAVTLFSDTIKKGYAPNETSGAISTGGFETGKFGMQLCATWDIATFQSMIGDSFKWDVVMLPNNAEFNTRMLSTYRGNGWSMSSATTEKDTAWDFIKYMTTDTSAQKKAQSFGIPDLLSYSNSDEYLKDYGTGSAYDKQVFADMRSHTTSFYNLGAYAQINDVIKSQYELVLADKLTVDQMIEEVQSQGESILATSAS